MKLSQPFSGAGIERWQPYLDFSGTAARTSPPLIDRCWKCKTWKSCFSPTLPSFPPLGSISPLPLILCLSFHTSVYTPRPLRRPSLPRECVCCPTWSVEPPRLINSESPGNAKKLSGTRSGRAGGGQEDDLPHLHGEKVKGRYPEPDGRLNLQRTNSSFNENFSQ